jgi:hypothetical protein
MTTKSPLPLLTATLISWSLSVTTMAGPIAIPASKYFGQGKPQISNPKGAQRSGRGVINSARAALEGEYLNVFLETPLPVTGEIAYRIWLNQATPGQKAEVMLAFPLANYIRIHDSGKGTNVPIQVDTSEGVFLKIPKVSLPAKFRNEKRLVILDVTSVDVKDTIKEFDKIEGAFGVIVAK